MNVKINKYFLVLLLIILVLGILNLTIGNSKSKSNTYLNSIENLYDEYLSIKELLEVETNNYYDNNYLSEYSVKEIRDKYIKMEVKVKKIINEIKSFKNDFKGLNEKYVLDIAENIMSIINSNFLKNDVFNSEDEVIIKQFHKINSDLKLVFNKYKMLKIAF